MASLQITVYCVSLTSRSDVLSFTKLGGGGGERKGALFCRAELVSALQIGTRCSFPSHLPTASLRANIREHPETLLDVRAVLGVEAVPSFSAG